MNYGLITKAFPTNEVSDEQMALINHYSRRPLEKEEVFVFSINLCDNEVDRDFERFSISALEKLEALMLGKTGIFDHNSKTENQTARIFATEVAMSSDKTTSAGEAYCVLKGYAYMLRCSKNTDLILEIDGGIKKEVSISCSVGKMYCSVCGGERKTTACEHKSGTEYTIDGVKAQCHTILDEPADAYEWSFVAVPAQRLAGVTKSFAKVGSKEKGSDFMNENIIKKLSLSTDVALSKDEAEALSQHINELTSLANIGEEYREGLRKEFVKLSAFVYPAMNSAIAEEASKKMSAEELKEFGKAFGVNASAKLPVAFQLFNEETFAQTGNNEFRI